MVNIVGVKELRKNLETYIKEVKKGRSYIVVRRSKPLFKISSLSEDSDFWEPVIDFTKIKKGGITVSDLLLRL